MASSDTEHTALCEEEGCSAPAVNMCPAPSCLKLLCRAHWSAHVGRHLGDMSTAISEMGENWRRALAALQGQPTAEDGGES